jgi:tagaturonate epimerase
MNLEKYSIGVGDRFGCEGKAQLQALIKANEQGCEIVPVWNKSHREHAITSTLPASVRREAGMAVKKLGWKHSYYVDADHIGMKNVDHFIDASDFFTLDVADFVGQTTDEDSIRASAEEFHKSSHSPKIPGLAEPLAMSAAAVENAAGKYLAAVNEAGRIYRHIEARKSADSFVAELSMDETDTAQSPAEMLVILAAVAKEKIPIQTIAPKFIGRFNKGVDYAGDVAEFARQFEAHLAVLAFAVQEFGLPANLKLSIHSGSDKFSLYPVVKEALRKYNAGLHLKTAGTTWLEELIGLAQADGNGLEIAKEIYRKAWPRAVELCKPYATVIDIDLKKLPLVERVLTWASGEFVGALRHDQACRSYSPDFRQFMHVSYKVAAEMGVKYLDAIRAHESVIAENVTTNIFDRHIKPLFLPVG